MAGKNGTSKNGSNGSASAAKQARKRKANQTSFKSGQSGNPNGRPKRGETLRDCMLRGWHGKTREEKDAEVASWFARARHDSSMLKVLADRIDGPVTQKLEGRIDHRIMSDEDRERAAELLAELRGD